MSIPQSDRPAIRKPLRLWPGVVIVVLQWLIRFGVPAIWPEAMPIGVIGGLVGGLAMVVWWVFFSRAAWSERLGAVLLMGLALVGTMRVVHVSISGGAMGMLFPLLAVPGICLAFVASLVATRQLADGPRRAWMAAAILVACGVWTLVRTGGFTADMDNDFAWRWTPTPEERLLAQARDEPVVKPSAPTAVKTTDEPPVAKPVAEPTPSPSAPLAVKTREEPAPPPSPPAVVKTGADWPGFRGPERDGVVRGVRIGTDWEAKPPVQLWRRPIGPGWSSFAVRDGLIYTQEQRGDDEVVACYHAATGEPVWKHRDAARFWESNAGAGPRGTPTLANGRVYTMGATGIVNALDAADGAVVWSRNAASDTGKKVPYWGFAGSPLALDDIVIVAAAGKLVAYDRATGKPRWFGPDGGGGYSSPHLARIGGVAQVLLLNTTGAVSVAPADGQVLWQHSWPGDGIVQPGLIADGDVLLGSGSGFDGVGVRRIAVAHGPSRWTVQERWTSIGLKPYFNDFVVHKGHGFGFDGNILGCIDLADGKRKWKGGRYGHGQLVLLPDQDLLLVLSEEGELALVNAAPDQFTELARLPAIQGKTWNHPVVAGDVLLVRNGEEMVAFRLPPASD